MTPSPTLPQRGVAAAYAILRRTEAAAMARMEAAQTWAERPHSTEHARTRAYAALCAAERAAIDATAARRTFERRHPSVREVA